MNKKGQVWVETVIYTLIAFALIAAVLAFVKPKIDELQDKAVIEQSVALMKDVDSLVREVVQGGSGNRRKLGMTIKDGSLTIDSQHDAIFFDIETGYVYSEPGKIIPEGNLLIKTEEKGKGYTVTINRSYDNYNITYNGAEQEKIFGKAATSYNIFITNQGKINDIWQVNIELG